MAADAPAQARRHRGVRAFLLTWTGMDGWADTFDPIAIGPALTDAQWTAFEVTVQATVTFAAHASTARTARTG